MVQKISRKLFETNRGSLFYRHEPERGAAAVSLVIKPKNSDVEFQMIFRGLMKSEDQDGWVREDDDYKIAVTLVTVEGHMSAACDVLFRGQTADYVKEDHLPPQLNALVERHVRGRLPNAA